jgi:hypothetical protein
MFQHPLWPILNIVDRQRTLLAQGSPDEGTLTNAVKNEKAELS